MVLFNGINYKDIEFEFAQSSSTEFLQNLTHHWSL